MTDRLASAHLGMGRDEFVSLLSRLQESTRYLLKGDALALAGLVTLASVFKLAPNQALDFVATRLWFLNLIVGLIAGLLLYNCALVVISRTQEPHANHVLGRGLSLIYGALVVLHCVAMAFTVGYITGYLQQRAHP